MIRLIKGAKVVPGMLFKPFVFRIDAIESSNITRQVQFWIGSIAREVKRHLDIGKLANLFQDAKSTVVWILRLG